MLLILQKNRRRGHQVSCNSREGQDYHLDFQDQGKDLEKLPSGERELHAKSGCSPPGMYLISLSFLQWFLLRS
jgi:hypothetical protein